MNTTPRKFYAAEDGNNPYPGCKILTAENPNGQNSTSSGQPDKKLTPMAAHRTFYEVLKKHQQENKCFLTSNEIHTILNAVEEYASQQAPEGMYTREQVEGAWNAGYERCNFELYPERFNKQPQTRVQFIQSLK